MRNSVVIFHGAILGAVAIFVFFNIQQARAYAVGTSSAPAGTGYDPGSSLQNLVSPFTSFFNNLKWNNNTTINVNNPGTNWPTVNITPVVENSFEGIISGWFTGFDAWFYGLTGVQLSGIFFVILNVISWTLGVAQKVVDWLLGLFTLGH